MVSKREERRKTKRVLVWVSFLLTKGERMGKKYTSDLSERLSKFAVEVMKLLGEIQGGKELVVVKYQVSKSATSIGANDRK